MASIERTADLDDDLGAAYTVTSRVRLDQFGDELAQAMGWKDMVPLSANGNPDVATQANPVVIHIGRAGISKERVLEVGKAHKPSDEYVVPVNLRPTFEQVVAKAKAKGVLTEEEIQVALRGLIGLSGA